jgi:hypothetical protein
LHGWSEGVDAVQGGVSDMSWMPADQRLPCYRVTSLYPAAIDLENQIELDAAYADLVRDEAAAINLVPVFNSNYSYDQEWWFKGGIADLGDLQGKQVRSIGPLVSLMIETWGGAPVFVAPKEVFQSAERGVVDGINMGVATYSSWKLWDVMPYMVNANLFYGNIQYMMNKSKFDSMTADEQAAVMEAARETEEWLKPLYEDWVDQRVGNAVMKGGGGRGGARADGVDHLRRFYPLRAQRTRPHGDRGDGALALSGGLCGPGLCDARGCLSQGHHADRHVAADGAQGGGGGQSLRDAGGGPLLFARRRKRDDPLIQLGCLVGNPALAALCVLGTRRARAAALLSLRNVAADQAYPHPGTGGLSDGMV